MNIQNIPSHSRFINKPTQEIHDKEVPKYTPLAKLLARQARPGTAHDGSGNEAENYSSISATNQHQLSQKK